MSVTKIKEAENKKVKSDEIITNLITDFQTILTDAIKIKIRADELKKYKELKDRGVITEEEFQTKKDKLMNLL